MKKILVIESIFKQPDMKLVWLNRSQKYHTILRIKKDIGKAAVVIISFIQSSGSLLDEE